MKKDWGFNSYGERTRIYRRVYVGTKNTPAHPPSNLSAMANSAMVGGRRRPARRPRRSEHVGVMVQTRADAGRPAAGAHGAQRRCIGLQKQARCGVDNGASMG